jgi:hypothetical protein
MSQGEIIVIKQISTKVKGFIINCKDLMKSKEIMAQNSPEKGFSEEVSTNPQSTNHPLSVELLQRMNDGGKTY